MSEYLISGRDPDGRKQTVRIDAESADEAVDSLDDLGYTELVLHTDEVGARYTNQSAVEEHISPKDYIQLRNRQGFFGLPLFIAGRIYAKGWFSFCLCAASIGYRRSQELPWGVWDYIMAAYLAFPLFLGLSSRFRSPSGAYHRLIEAASWGEWERVLELLPTLPPKTPPEERAFREAQALAGLGRFDEGIKVLEPFSDGKQIPEWLYLSRLPELYYAAGDRKPALAIIGRAAELAPDNATVLVEFARALIRYGNDLPRAREVLDRAKSHAISDILAPFVLMTEGMLALEMGRPAEAKDFFDRTVRGLEPFRGASPMIGSAVDSIHAYQALAFAAMGEPIEAAKHYKQAEPRLRALKSEDLIRRCEQAVAGFKA